MEGDSLTASGRIQLLEPEENKKQPFFYANIDQCPPHLTCERIQLNTEDVYKEFRLRGYEYGANFRLVGKGVIILVS